MEEILHLENLKKAVARVRSNGGAPGIDGMTVVALGEYLGTNLLKLREEVLSGRYRPSSVRVVKIPKPSGGTRSLGIPTVLDRVVQQAILQVLQAQFDPTFSEASYGFRPGRNAHQAIRAAQTHVRAGYRWVVDMDLERFFDLVNHDILMARLATRISDKRLLRLIRRFLQSGLLEGGTMSPRIQGTPQGGPLSPLLSNVLLDELDKELERRGHRFVRYADDCNIYVRSERAGQRVLQSLRRFLWNRLRLVVNEKKSKVTRPWDSKFLGYTILKDARLQVSKDAIKRLREKLQKEFRRGRGKALGDTIATLSPILRGWMGYFRHAETVTPFKDTDRWIRRHLRAILWRQWKVPKTRERQMRKAGLRADFAYRSAWNGRGPWWNSNKRHLCIAIPDRTFTSQGHLTLFHWHQTLQC